MNSTEIFLSSQLGGSDVADRLHNLILQTRKKLKRLDKSYCNEITVFQIFLRISGDITEFSEGNGIHYIKLFQKKRSISADIIIGREVWLQKSNNEIAKYLNEQIVNVVRLMSQRIENKNINILSKELIEDVRELLV